MPQRAMPTVAAIDQSLRSAMQASGLGMAIADLSGHWVEVNDALASMIGCHAGRCAGQSMLARVHSDDRAAVSGLLDGLAHDGRHALDAEWRYLRDDGSRVWVQANVGVIRDGAGAARSLLVQLLDVSARHSAEDGGHTEAHDRADRQLQLFSDAIAHDLRAPLRAIESFSGLLERNAAGRLDDAARDYLQRIRSAAARMGSLLVALGELSSVTHAKLTPAQVDLSLLAEWVAVELQEADPGRRAQIEIQPGLLGWGDERLLKQLLQQLLGNAWNFSRASDPAHIQVSGGCAGDTTRLVVCDDGLGFDPRYAHKLFEPFQRLHGADQGAGHGLGLAIAQRIAERHDGRISAESTPGHGATFRVELPAAPQAEEPSHA